MLKLPLLGILTITISYPKIPKLGRIVLQEQTFINAVSDLIINPEHMKDFIKRRNYFAYKSSYSGTPVLKIKIDSTGIYRMYYTQLAAVSSEDLSSIDPAKIQIFNGRLNIFSNGYKIRIMEAAQKNFHKFDVPISLQLQLSGCLKS